MAKAMVIDRFKRGEAVKALDDLPGVPKGTKGRVYLIGGFTWIRYRVLFENGVDIGSLDGTALARPKQFEEALARREQAAQAADVATDGEGADDGAAAGGSEGESKAVNGVTVPAHLLERSRSARQRLAA